MPTHVPELGAPVIGERRGGPDAAAYDAEDVLSEHAAVIEAWIAGQRRNVANSPLKIHQTSLQHPEYRVDYQNQFGRETITKSPVSRIPLPPGSEPGGEQPTEAYERTSTDSNPPPANELYLMVLYKTDSIAAVRMSALPSIVVDYIGTAGKSSWSVNATRHLTMQAKLGKTNWLMLPLDLTGKDAAVNHYLYANSFTTRVSVPEAAASNAPLFNGTDTVAYTVGGTYTLDHGNLTQIASPYVPFPNGLPSGMSAIDSDGTCYYGAVASGQCSLTTDTGFNNALVQAMYQEIADATKDGTVSISSCTGMAYRHYFTDYQNQQHIYTQVNVTHSEWIVDVFSTQPTQQGASVAAYGYYGSGAMGVTPQLKDVNMASNDGNMLSFDGQGFDLVELPSLGSDFSTTLPLMSQGPSGLTVNMVPVAASQTNNAQSTFDTASAQSCPISFINANQNFEYADTSSGEPLLVDYKDCTDYLFTGYAPSLPPRPPRASWTPSVIEGYYETCMALVASYYNLTHSYRHKTTPVEVTYKLEPGAIYGTSGEYSSQPAGYPTNDLDYMSVILVGSAGTQTVEEWSLMGLPLVHATKVVGGQACTLNALGETLSYTKDADSQATTGSEGSILAYSFPPMMGDRSYHLTTTGDVGPSVFTLTTPYDTYTLDPSTATISGLGFGGWLHLTNGKATLQGYTVNATNVFLYYNGDAKTNLVDDLTKALKCDQNDLRTMVMDVTLDTIKNLSGVQSASY